MIRRAIDVAVAGVVLLVLSPLLAVLAILVRVRLGSPVLFRQERSGLHGEVFTIVKLRTMRAERHPGEPDTDRTPRLGRVLRSSSLDELPQLWNVLRGEMSLIGPRPTLPEQVAQYSERERGRLAIRPGLTGWAQVNGRNAISWPERIELDLEYIERRSLRLDLEILWRTARRLVRPEGISGEGGVNPGYPGPDGGPGPDDGPSPTRPTGPA